jgi:predicted signal transduction protein with EAL and GGDEF domain
MGRVTISGGVATFPMDAGEPEELLKRADEALYQAKGSGRDRVRPYASAQLGFDDPELPESLEHEARHTETENQFDPEPR